MPVTAAVWREPQSFGFHQKSGHAADLQEASRCGFCQESEVSRVRLLRLDIAGFRSIRYQALAAEGLVVLFGPNSSGKTSVLEAAEQLIARSAIRRTDPAEVWELYAEGSVTFALPAADADGSSDAEVYRWLLCGDHSDERAWDWLGGYTSERIRGAGLGDAREQLAARLAQSGVAGSRADRELLARSLFDPGAAFFLAGDGGVLLHARSASLTTETLAAATRIAETAMDVDPLSAMAEHLVAEGSARVGDLADSAEVRERLAAAFPPVIVLDGDADSLAAEIENVIPRIHDRLWNLRLPKTPLPGLTGAYGQRHDPFEMAYDTTSSTSLSADLWLEGMSASGEAVIGGVFGPYDTGEWSRVRHSVLAVARMIEDEANRVAPSFVRSQGTIGIELIPVAAWRAGQHRVRATFTEPGADRRDLRVVGAGTARWAAASIRLACRRLAEARQVVTGAGATALANADGIQEEVRRARTSPLTQTAVRLEPSDAPGFYIADEPEQHLHPAAIRSVRDWLTQLAGLSAHARVLPLEVI